MVMLTKVFLDICLLRAKPQDLPAAEFLLGMTLFTYTLAGVAVAVINMPLKDAVLCALAGTLILATLTHTTLMLRRLPARLNQTLSALAGSGTVLGAIAWLLIVSHAPPIFLLALLVWSLAITAHVLRHALSVSLGMGIGVSLAYLLVSFIIMSALFPPASQ